MQLAELVTEVLANGFDPIQFGRDRVVRYINDGYAYICSQVNYPGDEAILDFTTADGQDTYPQPADASSLRELYDLDRHQTMQVVGLKTLDRSPPTRGAPMYYALNGPNFQLYPTPNNPFNMRCRYWQIPPPLVADTDVPVIPVMWHWLLWTWATAQAFRAEDDVQRAGGWDQRFQVGLADFAATSKFPSDMETVAHSMWNPQPSVRRRWVLP
jgi:hypothetical protein